MKHILKSRNFSPDFIESLFAQTGEYIRIPARWYKTCNERILGLLFYNSSTRTVSSLESAMYRLGGEVIKIDNAVQSSSVAKGESLEDTVQYFGNYVNVIALRHSEQGAAERAASASKVPIINAGDGKGEHPTQALVDLYTIKREIGRTDCLRVALVGDLKTGRAARSFAYLLGKRKDIHFNLISSPDLRIA